MHPIILFEVAVKDLFLIFSKHWNTNPVKAEKVIQINAFEYAKYSEF